MQAKTKISESYLSDPASNIWDYLSLAAISLCLLVFIVQWRQLPFFLDMYYHLGVAKGFEAAGGISLINFWEYGPNGIPHLYPPLLHFIMMLFIKTGISGIELLKYISILMPALLLLTLWYIIKNIINKITAFFVVFLSLCASVFLISISFTPAATLASIFLLLGLYFMHKNYTIPAALLFGLIAYTHTSISLVAFMFLLLSRTFKIIDNKQFLKILFLSLGIAFPWIAHMIHTVPEIAFKASANMPIRIYPVITLFFIAGLFIAIRQFEKYKVPFVLMLSLASMTVLYPFRFFCSQGMIGLLVFSGIGLEYIHSQVTCRMAKNTKLKQYISFFTIIILSYIILFSPSMEYHDKNIRFKIYDSFAASAFEGTSPESKDILSMGFFDAKVFNELADIVEKHTKKNEFIWSNNRYIAGIIGIMTGRPTLTNMLLEIQPKIKKININNAKLLILVNYQNETPKKISEIIENNFHIITKKNISTMELSLYENNMLPVIKIKYVPRPVINSKIAYIASLIYVLLILYFIKNKRGTQL
jgi:hypothetical protein